MSLMGEKKADKLRRTGEGSLYSGLINYRYSLFGFHPIGVSKLKPRG